MRAPVQVDSTALVDYEFFAALNGECVCTIEWYKLVSDNRHARPFLPYLVSVKPLFEGSGVKEFWDPHSMWKARGARRDAFDEDDPENGPDPDSDPDEHMSDDSWPEFLRHLSDDSGEDIVDSAGDVEMDEDFFPMEQKHVPRSPQKHTTANFEFSRKSSP